MEYRRSEVRRSDLGRPGTTRPSSGPGRTSSPRRRQRNTLVKEAGRTVCSRSERTVRGYSTAWSEPRCTAIPVDDRTLDKQPNSAWGSYKRSDCYKNTYVGNGGGTGAVLRSTRPRSRIWRCSWRRGRGSGLSRLRVNGNAVKKDLAAGSQDQVRRARGREEVSTAPRRGRRHRGRDAR